MNRSLAPLIVFMSFIILVTIILINVREPQKQADDPLHQPFLSIKSPEYRKLPPLGAGEQNKQADASMPDVDKIMREVLKDLNAGKEGDAEDKLKTILVFDPFNLNALSILGNIFYASKKYQEAELIFRKQLKVKPENATIYNNLGTVLARQEKYDEAITCSLKSLELEPDSPAADMNLAGIYSSSGNTERALFHFRKTYERIGERIIPLSYDPALDNIRYEYEFQNILGEAREIIRKKRDAASNGEIFYQQPPVKSENEQN